jgi:NADH-quinone oxidoreductase subunit G
MKLSIKLVGALTSKPYAFSARSWELESLDFIDFYDTLLSNVQLDIRGLTIMRILPRINETLNEEWISDKIRFSYDAFRRQRLLVPMLRLNENFISVDWEESFFFFFFKYNIRSYEILSSINLFGILGKFIDLESILAFKTFFDSFNMGISKIFFQNSSIIQPEFTNSFLLNNNILSLAKADCIVLIGSNLRYTHPVLHIKLLRLANQGVPIFAMGVSSSIKAKIYSFGFSLKNFINFLEGKNKYSLIISKSKNPFVLLGESIYKRIDFYNYSKIFFFLFELKFSIGYLSTDLTELSALALGIKPLQDSFKLEEKTFNFVYNYNTDDINFLINSNKSLFIYQGHHGDLGALSSDVIYPSTFLLEKKGTFLNLEGKFVKFNLNLKPSLLIRTDWRIFKALSLYFSSEFSYKIERFKDFHKLIIKYLPSWEKGVLISLSLFLEDSFSLFRFWNIPILSLYTNYFMTDQVSRSSKVMSLTLLKFKNNFFNF